MYVDTVLHKKNYNKRTKQIFFFGGSPPSVDLTTRVIISGCAICRSVIGPARFADSADRQIALDIALPDAKD